MPQDQTNVSPLIDVQFSLAQDQQLLDQFLAHQIFPALTVGEKSGNIPRWLRRARVENVKRQKDGSFQRVESAVDDVTYACESAGLEERLPDEDRKHFGRRHFDAEMKIARGVVRSLLIARENAVASSLFSTNTFGAGYNTAGTAAWDHASNSDPLKDVREAKELVRKRIGAAPNCMVIGAGAKKKLDLNEKVLAQVKTLRGYAGDLNASHIDLDLDVLARVFGLKKIYVGETVKDTAKEGQTPIMADIWGDTFALPFYQDFTDVDNVGLGRMINWLDDELLSDLADAEEMESNPLAGFRVEKYRENQTKGDVIRVEEYNQFKILNKDAAHLITGL